MAQSKTYISLRVLELHTMVVVDGRSVLIPFVGGTRGPVRRNGIFVTSDLKIQNALEDSPGFGVRFDIMKSTVRSKVPMIVRESPVVQDDEPDAMQVPGITSAQKAKDWFIENYPEIDSSDLANKAKILAKAKEMNIVFTDWL